MCGGLSIVMIIHAVLICCLHGPRAIHHAVWEARPCTIRMRTAPASSTPELNPDTTGKNKAFPGGGASFPASHARGRSYLVWEGNAMSTSRRKDKRMQTLAVAHPIPCVTKKRHREEQNRSVSQNKTKTTHTTAATS